VATVGKPEPSAREPVIVILEPTSLLNHTATRGVIGDIPVLAGEPYRVIDFEPA
jgi:hypothetical protein